MENYAMLLNAFTGLVKKMSWIINNPNIPMELRGEVLEANAMAMLIFERKEAFEKTFFEQNAAASAEIAAREKMEVFAAAARHSAFLEQQKQASEAAAAAASAASVAIAAKNAEKPILPPPVPPSAPLIAKLVQKEAAAPKPAIVEIAKKPAVANLDVIAKQQAAEIISEIIKPALKDNNSENDEASIYAEEEEQQEDDDSDEKKWMEGNIGYFSGLCPIGKKFVQNLFKKAEIKKFKDGKTLKVVEGRHVPRFTWPTDLKGNYYEKLQDVAAGFKFETRFDRDPKNRADRNPIMYIILGEENKKKI